MADETVDETEQDARERAERARLENNNSRLSRLSQIADQADENKSREEELTDLDDDAWNERETPRQPHNHAEEEDPARAIADAQKQDEELDEARAAGADDVKVTNGVTYYRLVINGREKWLTLAELRTTASKVESGDEYLRTAKEAARTVIEQVPSQVDEPAGPNKDRARELIANAMMGDQEAIDELAGFISAKSSSPEDVLRAVDERVDGRLTFRDAVKEFNRDYARELKIPVVKKFIEDRDEELARLHPTMSFAERLKMAGDEGRAMWRESLQVAGAVEGASRIEEKRQRKAQVRVPQAASGRPSADLTDDEGDESYSDSIGSMAKARGQARPIIHSKR